MKIIELRRHSKKRGPGNTDLSEEGVELAKKVGSESLRGKGFTDFFVSTLVRTSETLQAFREGAGDFPDVKPMIFAPHVEVGETSDCMKLWQGACHGAEQRGEDMMVCTLKEEHELSMKTAELGAQSFKKWVDSLPQDCHTLVVGHSPFFELVILGLFEITMKQLQPCEGFVIIEDGKLRFDGERRIVE